MVPSKIDGQRPIIDILTKLVVHINVQLNIKK